MNINVLKETRELAEFLAAFAKGIRGAMEDGKATFGDVFRFFDAGKLAPKAFVGIESIPAEFKTYGSDAKEEIMEIFAQNFDIPNDELEAHVEAIWDATVLQVTSILALVRYMKARPQVA